VSTALAIVALVGGVGLVIVAAEALVDGFISSPSTPA
jgi:hypothetical protein